MDPSLISVVVVLAHVGIILLGGLAYLRRARVDRPPVGVFNGRDVLVVAAALVVNPPVYLAVPTLALAAALAVVSTVMLYFSLSPLLVAVGRAASPSSWLFST